MAGTYQIRTKTGLSKPYTMERLREKHARGQVHASARCTADNGRSFVPLSEILDPHTASAASPSGRLRPVGHKAASRSRVPPQISPSMFDDFLPSVNAVESTPPKEDVAEQIVPSNLRQDEETESIDSDTYAIPEPPSSSMELQTERAAAASAGRLLSRATASAADSEPSERTTETSAANKPLMSAIQRAAAEALAAEDRSQKTELSPQLSASVYETSVDYDDTGDSAARTSIGSRWLSMQSIVVGLMGAMVALAGVVSGRLMTRGNADVFASIDGLSADDSAGPLSVEELTARTQIMGVQISRLTKAFQNDDQHLPELEDLPVAKPAFPLVPYVRRTATDDEQARSDELLAKYAKLVQQKGPDGRQLDAASVDLYTGYLQQLIREVDTKGPERIAALQELSELTKLLYLLRLPDLLSSDAEQRRHGQDLILQASNVGLGQIYIEYRTGDMRFPDIFQAVDSAEQSALVLIRYWCHRSANRQSADKWLDQMLTVVDDQHYEALRRSIDEVEEIEDL